MSSDPKGLALSLWQALGHSPTGTLGAADSPLVGDLVHALGLSDPPRASISILVPTTRPGAAVSLEASPGGGYLVARAAPEEAPLVIETRRGDLLVDADDPLARARRSIAELERI